MEPPVLPSPQWVRPPLLAIRATAKWLKANIIYLCKGGRTWAVSASTVAMLLSVGADLVKISSNALTASSSFCGTLGVFA